MNSVFTRITIFTFSFFIFHFSLNAQQWRWGAKGGSADDAGGQYERVRDMATDANGNVYTLATVYNGAMNVNNTSRTGWGNSDMMLASFSCDGTLRWSKIIGGPGGDQAWALAVDKNGGVYVGGNMSTNQGTWTMHIDADATFTPPASDYRAFYLIKYDANGSLQWYKTPQADTVSMYAFSLTGAICMDVDDNDNVHMFCKLSEGEYGGTGGFIVNNVGDYILKYDASGNFIGGSNLDINIEGGSIRDVKMVKNKHNGNYYLGSYIDVIDHVTIGGNPINGYSYLACFNDVGQLLWYKESTGDASIISGFAIDDKDDNIYVTGYCGSSGSFAGYPLTSTSTLSRPFVMALDPVGNPIWASQANTSNAQSLGRCVAIRNSGEIVVGINYVGTLSWPGRTETFFAGLYNTAIARFAKNGKVLELINLVSNNGSVNDGQIVSDGRDNIFIGGDFSQDLTVNGQALYSTGGEADWWMAKYGYDCNCAEIPEPSFSFTRNGYDLDFSYTGSNNYTTLEWDFGDGTTATGATTSHTYPANSYQTVCVKVTNDCGDNIYCENIPLWPTDVSSVSKEVGISIYPNPASDNVNIDNAGIGTQLQLLDITGRTIHTQILNADYEQLDLSAYPSGNYIIEFTDKNGGRVVKKVSKR